MASMGKRPRKDGDETDAFSRTARKWFHWRAGERKAAKSRANRRERRAARQGL